MIDPNNGLTVGTLVFNRRSTMIWEVTELTPRITTAEQVQRWPFYYGNVVGVPHYSLATIEPRYGAKQQRICGLARKRTVDFLTRVTPEMVQERIRRWQTMLPLVGTTLIVPAPRYTYGDLLYSREDGAPIGWVIGIIRRDEWEYLIRQADGAEYDLAEPYFMNEAERAVWLSGPLNIDNGAAHGSSAIA